MTNTLFKDGEFFIGCNYWASHAGTNMWHDWQPDIVERDFKQLAENNVKYLRVFPLWSDFQPLRMLLECRGAEKEIRMGEDPLPFTEAGRAGVDIVMADRFAVFCELAEKYDIKLVVGLITGWMSGRLYVPQIFEHVNNLRDARSIKWQIKFVRYMVKRFKDSPAIYAWDLGNECNCLGDARDPDGAYLWASAITMAIKLEDSEKPVISGMHGSFPDSNFRPQDLGEILDVLCTHPYPLFTRHCATDPITEQKSTLHAVAETVVYRGLSGKPAFAEEVGTLGPMIASEENSAAYANTILYQLWAHNCLGFMWWCGFEQTKLTHAPYDWCAVERELGLFHEDYSPKPVVKAMSAFAEFTEAFGKLPERLTDAVCILNAENDTWLSAYGSFILAKQAGLDLEYAYVNDEIPEARAYILPSVNHTHLQGHVMSDLIERVKKGAVLYVSVGGECLLSPFKELYGIIPQCHYKPLHPDTVELDGTKFSFTPNYKIPYAEYTAEILARDEAGTPVFARNKLGEGYIYFLAYPLEEIVGGVPGVASGEGFKPYYKFYKAMSELRNPAKAVTCDNPHVTITEHITDGNGRIVVAVNSVPRESTAVLRADGLHLSAIRKENGAVIEADNSTVTLTMKPNSAVVIELAE